MPAFLFFLFCSLNLFWNSSSISSRDTMNCDTAAAVA
jgi:hypothetical protein